jgi:TusA-related sulfurtransferase
VDTEEFDICGQLCPSTLLTALKEINKHEQRIRDGLKIISFKTDNRDAVVTIPESAENMGYSVSVVKMDGYYQIDIFAGGK